MRRVQEIINQIATRRAQNTEIGPLVSQAREIARRATDAFPNQEPNYVKEKYKLMIRSNDCMEHNL